MASVFAEPQFQFAVFFRGNARFSLTAIRGSRYKGRAPDVSNSTCGWQRQPTTAAPDGT